MALLTFSVYPQIPPYFVPGYVSQPEYTYHPEQVYPPPEANFPVAQKSPAEPLGSSATFDKGSANSNLFVFHLPASVDDNALFALFAPFGSLQSVRVCKLCFMYNSLQVMVDPATGRSRGFGFVQYRHFSEAVRAIAGMNGYQLENKYLKVAFKTPTDKEKIMGGKPGRTKRGRPGRKGRNLKNSNENNENFSTATDRNLPPGTVFETELERLKVLSLDDSKLPN